MQQCLHLLVVDRDRRSVLIQTVERRWMLPVVGCSERARAPLVAARWLAARQIKGVVAGQWLGRIAADGRSIDWLVAILSGPPLDSPQHSWAPIEGLAALGAVLEYQAWAAKQAAARGGVGVAGPFGSLDWIAGAREWMLNEGVDDASNPTCFRASPYDVVLSVRSRRGAVYFKGAAADRASDLRAMVGAARQFPDSFPRTLAYEDGCETARCLLEGCAGVPLAKVRSQQDAVRLASDMGRLQQSISCELSQSRLKLFDVLEAADRLVEGANVPPLSIAARRAFDDVASLPEGWTPLDLDPSNVFIDGRSIRYIDLEPRIAAMPVALSLFARRLGATCDFLRALRGAYESASGAGVPWPSVDLVSEIAETVVGWQMVMRNVACGEVSGPLDRVARAVAVRLASARPLV